MQIFLLGSAVCSSDMPSATKVALISAYTATIVATLVLIVIYASGKGYAAVFLSTLLYAGSTAGALLLDKATRPVEVQRADSLSFMRCFTSGEVPSSVC